MASCLKGYLTSNTFAEDYRYYLIDVYFADNQNCSSVVLRGPKDDDYYLQKLFYYFGGGDEYNRPTKYSHMVVNAKRSDIIDFDKTPRKYTDSITFPFEMVGFLKNGVVVNGTGVSRYSPWKVEKTFNTQKDAWDYNVFKWDRFSPYRVTTITISKEWKAPDYSESYKVPIK